MVAKLGRSMLRPYKPEKPLQRETAA